MTSGLHSHGPIPASLLQSSRSSGQMLYCMDSIPVGQEFHNPQAIVVPDHCLFGKKMQIHSQNWYLSP